MFDRIERGAQWEDIVGRVVIVNGQADLLEVVGALCARAASRADCTAGSKSADEHCDDGDHHQQLDQRKPRRNDEFTRNLLEMTGRMNGQTSPGRKLRNRHDEGG